MVSVNQGIRIQSKRRKIRAIKKPKTFYAVLVRMHLPSSIKATKKLMCHS